MDPDDPTFFQVHPITRKCWMPQGGAHPHCLKSSAYWQTRHALDDYRKCLDALTVFIRWTKYTEHWTVRLCRKFGMNFDIEDEIDRILWPR